MHGPSKDAINFVWGDNVKARNNSQLLHSLLLGQSLIILLWYVLTGGIIDKFR